MCAHFETQSNQSSSLANQAFILQTDHINDSKQTDALFTATSLRGHGKERGWYILLFTYLLYGAIGTS